MQVVAVISASGKRLMPTTPYRARKLLKSGRAEILKHSPVFTIQLSGRDDGGVQPVEYKCDTGYLHIGISVCSESHEYISEQRDTLSDETERHNDRRKYRRDRRNRLRYRKPRPFKDTKPEGWLAPSIRHREEIHIRTFLEYREVFPITTAFFEMGKFDTHLLKALEEGRPVPEGADYQHGERYGSETLRLAVFSRDGYACTCCGRDAFRDGAKLHVHHIGFRRQDRTNRMANLATVCEQCHTPANHKQGGRLWNWKPKLKPFKGATYMSSVRWDILAKLKKAAPDVEIHATYGAKTKLAREKLGIPKTHADDAYAMGRSHPKRRAVFRHLQKRRRNNRILEKFRDAVYVDTRDGKKKKGSQLGCNRTNRREPRISDKNDRIYRGRKISGGCRLVRKKRYFWQPGMVAICKGKQYRVNGTNNKGKTVLLEDLRMIPLKEAKAAAGEKGLKEGRKILFQGGKRKVASVRQESGTAVLIFLISAKPEDLKPCKLKNGWEVIPQSGNKEGAPPPSEEGGSAPRERRFL